jgi:hypothetical protein
VPGDVSLRPVALAVCLVETASDNELTDVVAPVAGNCVITESQYEIHPMFARKAGYATASRAEQRSVPAQNGFAKKHPCECAECQIRSKG